MYIVVVLLRINYSIYLKKIRSEVGRPLASLHKDNNIRTSAYVEIVALGTLLYLTTPQGM